MSTADGRRVQRRIQAIKDRRAAKEEKERYDKMAEKMHRKRVERLKRRDSVRLNASSNWRLSDAVMMTPTLTAV